MARTANRGTMSASSPTSYNVMRWRLGKYIRLSKEDLLRGRDESNSVVNQRRLLEQYHQAHLDEFYEGAEADVYVDDGKTGTDTNREDFQRLLSDISSGRINCVIVKDLSRLSRNYTDAGNLIENLFVRLNVRFISLAEGVDSYRNPDSVSNIIVPITNVMNDQYCYQTSKKIRQVFDMKRRNGEFIGSYACQHHVVFAHIGRRAGKGRAACRFVRNRIISVFDKLYRKDLRLYEASGVWEVHTVLQAQSVPKLIHRAARGGRIEQDARSAALVARGGRRTAVVARGGRRTAVVARGGRRTAVVARGGCRTAVVACGGRRTAVVARGGRRTAVVARGGRRTTVVTRGGRRTAVVARGERGAAVIARGKAARALRRRGGRQHAHPHAQTQQCRDQTLFHIRSPLLFRPPASFPGKGGPFPGKWAAAHFR